MAEVRRFWIDLRVEDALTKDPDVQQVLLREFDATIPQLRKAVGQWAREVYKPWQAKDIDADELRRHVANLGWEEEGATLDKILALYPKVPPAVVEAKLRKMTKSGKFNEDKVYSVRPTVATPPF